jgi:formate C-acetyltransferase
MKKLLTMKIENKDIDLERIERMNQWMFNRKATICSQRAKIITKVFESNSQKPMIIKKAMAFKQILNDMTIYIEDDTLIVGNQASKNFAAPIFPEYSIQWVIDELDQFSKRSGDRFDIDEKTKDDLREIAEFWYGNTHNDVVENNLSNLNLLAEKQDVLHRGGISMSGDGHIVPNHKFVLEHGFAGIKNIAENYLKNDDLTQDQIDYYKSVIISMEGVLIYLERFEKLSAELSIKTNDYRRKEELQNISKVFKNIKENKINHFYEAIQVVYLVHLLMMIESNGHSFSFGRFDQYIFPYYENDINNKLITKEKALEIISHFFIKTNSINKVRPWGHTKYSGGYPLYSNLNCGGLKKDGTDGTNDISYLCLEAMALTGFPDPNLSVRFDKDTPKAFIKDVAKLIRRGFGMPSIFNDDVCIPSMMSLDIDEVTSRDYVPIGCVEIGIDGKWNHRATGMTYVNFAKILDLVMNNGYDIYTGVQLININGKAGKEITYNSYQELYEAYISMLSFYNKLSYDCDLVCDRSLKVFDTDPFASSTIDCSLERGLTLKNGGAEYDFISASNIGMSTVGDSLAAIKKLVFEDKKMTLKQLQSALNSNFEGEENSYLQKLCRNTPKFGNNIDYVDEIVTDIYNQYLEIIKDYRTDRNGKGPKGCRYTMSTSNITSYVPCGFNVSATADGRLKGKPLNEGASPCLGADKSGPFAVINSISKLPNKKMAGGQLLNMRFTPSTLEGDANLDKFTSFISSLRLKNIFHSQFNIVDSKTLREAKAHPEDYPDLMVRVAGYCALFSTLMPEAQDAIIERTEHELC